MLYQGINHVLLEVADLESARRFWKDVIGLLPHSRISRWFKINGCALHLLPVTDTRSEPARLRRFQHVALQVSDLAMVLARLLAAGAVPFQLELSGEERAVVAGEDLSRGSGTLFVRDPDGNLIEFVQIGHGMFQHEPNPFAAPARS